MATICTDADCRRPDLPRPARLLVGLAVTAALVVAAYFLVDQPVARFVHGLELERSRPLRWLTRPPEVFVLLSPVVLLAGLVRRCFAPWSRLERVAVAAAVATLGAALAAGLLKVAFGRHCPDVVLAAGADGFSPFSLEPACWALPSGHTACTLSVTVVAEAAWPRWRLCWSLLAGTVAVSLVALNHHFVGDIVAGAFLGWAIGETAARSFAIGGSGVAQGPIDG